MRNRLKAAVGGITEQGQRLRTRLPGSVGVDDDPDAEDLDPPPGLDDDVTDLAELDDGDAAPLDIEGDVPLFELLRRLDPAPAVPLTAPHTVGLVSLVERLGGEDDKRVRRILALVGDRLSLTAGPDGIAVRGILRRRHTPWDRIGRLTFADRYELLRGNYLQKLTDDLANRLTPIPIPGLRWLLRRVVGGLSGWLEHKVLTPEQIESMRQGAGGALTHVERRGFDIELSGPLLLVSILAPGFCAAVEEEATRRKVPIVREDAPALTDKK